MANLRALLFHGRERLSSGPHPERSRQDAELLLRFLLKADRAWVLGHLDAEVSSTESGPYEKWIERRYRGEPIQYITGETEFFGLPFTVAPGVLIPRPETEHLVEAVLRLAAGFETDRMQIADIGTGSGVVAVALAHTLPLAVIVATDLSAEALEIAEQNANRNQVEDRIDFLLGDVLAPMAGRAFHIVASNPPYIPLRDLESLAVEVREHEPHSALFAGGDGLEIYRRLIPGAIDLLLPGGWLALEIGYGQKSAVEKFLRDAGYREICFLADYQGIPRVACAQRP